MKVLVIGTGGVGESAAIAKRRDPKGDWLEVCHGRLQPGPCASVLAKLDDARFPADRWTRATSTR